MGPLPESVLSHMGDFDDPFSTAGDMKYHLQNLLDSKEKQLQQAGSLGQRVLAQQMELEERIRQLQVLESDKGEDDEIDLEARERYRELAETILSWDSENAQLSSAFGGSSKRFPNGDSHSPNVPYGDLPREEPERTKASASTSAAQSRRAKNAAHRADDVEFAFEIGSGLLTEVRRLQSLLGERDKAIQDMKEEKDDLEKTVEAIRTNLRQQEQSSDKYKEENWNLEVALQELRSQHGDAQAATQRLETEHKRLTKALALARDNADHHKIESEKLQSTLEELKNKHETDIAQARKHAAGLARDKSDLQQTIDTLKAENARAGRRLPRFGSPLTPGAKDGTDFLTPAGHDDHDSDVFGTTGGASTNRRKLDVSAMFSAEDLGSDFADSPEPSPLRKPFLAANHPSNEIEALQQRLAHAQRQITTLKGSLNREKQQRMRLEGGAGGNTVIDDEGDENEEYGDENTVAVEGKKLAKRSTTPFKVGATRGVRSGRGRGRGINDLIQKLGMAANSPASQYDDDDEPNFGDAPAVPPIPIHFSGPNDEEDEVSQFFGSNQGLGQQDDVEYEERQERISRSPSPSPLDPASNRTSVDGMDPAFANVLRRVPSNGSYAGSPLRQSVLGRSARGGVVPRRPRGGVPFKEARPPSIVDAPEVLAAELGGVDSSPMKSFNTSLLNEAEIPEEEDDGEEYIRVKKVEKIEFGCQTEMLEEEKTIILPEPTIIIPEPAPVLVIHSEMGVQSDPEPEPILPPKVIMLDMALQTELEPIAVKSEMGIQHDTPQPVVPVPPVLVDNGVGTDPVLKPTLVQAETQTKDIQPIPLVIGQGYTSSISSDSSHRATITQADVSHSSVSVGDSTIKRSFLVQRHEEEIDEEGIDEGEETETGADTDYHDARMSTPSEDFHSLLTMTDNDYSDSEEDDAESIKASDFSSVRGQSTLSVDRQSRIASFYGDVLAQTVTYETVGVSADLYEPPEPVIIEAPKPEVKEMSIQTDEWKPPAPVPAPAPAVIPAVIPAAPVQSLKSVIAPAPGLYRVGSTGHQFQFVAPPPPSSNGIPSPSAGIFGASSPVPTPLSSIFRDSTSTFGRRTAVSDRRQSIESLVSSGTAADEGSSRSRVPSSSTGSALLVAVDKTKPPMMALPPPPKLPPPASSMPPPALIPERRIPSSDGGPPPRPSSPPPPELIQRATTPLGSVLSVPGVKGVYNLRQHGSSMPPSQAGLRQPPSTSSFRSAANAANYAQGSILPSNVLSSHREGGRHEFSTTSLISEHSGMASPRSSISSDHHHRYHHTPVANEPPTTPDKTADLTPRANINAPSTDPVIIHAITQTMIGEFLYKYTRRTIGKGVGEKRHKRFFWVHPYTKTLYWSSADPGSSNVSESSAKSAYIEGVRSVLDPNPMPPGLYQYSVVISTPQREMKITAPTKERHDIWLNALKYLLSRPNNLNITSPVNNTILPQTPGSADHTDDDHRQQRQRLMTTPPGQRSPRSPTKKDTWTATPRGQRSRSQISMSRSASKRSGTPALEYLRWNHGPESPYSPEKSFVNVPVHDSEDLDFELHADSRFDEGFEGLENVRACCDGRHTVGHSGKIHHHHHHHHPHQQGTLNSRRSSDNQHLDPNLNENPRPSSPAWSFRSRTGSSQSHEGSGGGIFSWGRGEDGKLRFGSRRSAKSSLPVQD
ncbi:hypothetical protein BYT27DRAFT_7079180 [Phlegmacium glaucopus]|nr:hypothetical protein BYT27DRAFT_7079180 [Phlegmacium glaucopus]